MLTMEVVVNNDGLGTFVESLNICFLESAICTAWTQVVVVARSNVLYT